MKHIQAIRISVLTAGRSIHSHRFATLLIQVSASKKRCENQDHNTPQSICGCLADNNRVKIYTCEHRVSRYNGYDSYRRFCRGFYLDRYHLPVAKRHELEIIFSEVQQFRATKLSAKRANSRVLKVILYGSYARGDWVEDRLSGYRSDYDILIVVNSGAFAQEQELWLGLDERLLREQIAHRIETPVIPIIHSLHDVNDQLSRGRPFFVDIKRDGKILYEEDGHPLAQPRPLTKEEAKAEAQKNFEQWYKLSQEALVGAQLMLERNIWRHGAFMLHQAVEEAYHCLLLTLTLYSPKSHRIKVLRSKAEDLDKRLIDAWPRDSRMTVVVSSFSPAHVSRRAIRRTMRSPGRNLDGWWNECRHCRHRSRLSVRNASANAAADSKTLPWSWRHSSRPLARLLLTANPIAEVPRFVSSSWTA
jgi:predicted nucleotidyltransferase